MKKLALLFLLTLTVVIAHGQDSVRYRIILIGDVGELGKQQTGILKSVVSNVLSDFISYITPGQFGVTASYDIGRVGVKNEASNLWHDSVGGGIYFAPSDMAVLQFKGGCSKEGFYPYVNLN